MENYCYIVKYDADVVNASVNKIDDSLIFIERIEDAIDSVYLTKKEANERRDYLEEESNIVNPYLRNIFAWVERARLRREN